MTQLTALISATDYLEAFEEPRSLRRDLSPFRKPEFSIKCFTNFRQRNALPDRYRRAPIVFENF